MIEFYPDLFASALMNAAPKYFLSVTGTPLATLCSDSLSFRIDISINNEPVPVFLERMPTPGEYAFIAEEIVKHYREAQNTVILPSIEKIQSDA